MLREHVTDIMTRWCPKQRRGSRYDPTAFLETPEQARKLIRHLETRLVVAKSERNKELIAELQEALNIVEDLSRRFFRWERDIERALEAEEAKEFKKMPIRF
jgi:hypothetical protein